jgi:hypothetical protein
MFAEYCNFSLKTDARVPPPVASKPQMSLGPLPPEGRTWRARPVRACARNLYRGPLPANLAAEIDEKRALYFDAGATEVWPCNLDGSMSFLLVRVTIFCLTLYSALPWFAELLRAQQSPGGANSLNLASVIGPDVRPMTGNLVQHIKEGRVGLMQVILQKELRRESA